MRLRSGSLYSLCNHQQQKLTRLKKKWNSPLSHHVTAKLQLKPGTKQRARDASLLIKIPKLMGYFSNKSTVVAVAQPQQRENKDAMPGLDLSWPFVKNYVEKKTHYEQEIFHVWKWSGLLPGVFEALQQISVVLQVNFMINTQHGRSYSFRGRPQLIETKLFL